MALLSHAPAHACTVFVLTSTNATLLAHNHDSSGTRNRIWFQPAEDGCLGAVYAGPERSAWPSSGMNCKGLAFGWVGGIPQNWEPKPELQLVRGFPTRRMLESCATAKEAIAFYRTHYEPEFRHGTLLVADETGASATIGTADGKLSVEEARDSHGFGFGEATLEATFARKPAATAADAAKLLRDCHQSGGYPTRFSMLFDVHSRELTLYPSAEGQSEVKFNLDRELQKGAHYYDIPGVHEQLAGAPQPLPLALKRFPLDEFKPLTDQQPEVTSHVRDLVRNLAQGAPRAEDYHPEAWKALSGKEKSVQSEMKPLGEFLSAILVGHHEEKNRREYRYRLEFANVILLERFGFDEKGKVCSGLVDAIEWKPGASYPDLPLPPVVGIGVALGVRGTNIIITAILDKSPAAAQHELHVGDRILAVAQGANTPVPLHTTNLAAVATLISGAPGTTVRLTVVSQKEDPARAHVLSFTRANLQALSQ